MKAGTKIEIVASRLRGSDAGVGLADGSFIATANGGVVKFDPDGKMTTLVEDSEQAAGLAMDSKGRLFGAQYTKKVSVLYPKGSEETTHFQLRWQTLHPSERHRRRQEGRRLLHRLLSDRRDAITERSAAVGLLHRAEQEGHPGC